MWYNCVMNIAVIYDSKTNNTAKCAGWIASGAGKFEGVVARTFSIDEYRTFFEVFGQRMTGQVSCRR